MRNNELNKAVAEALGWTDFGITIAEGLVGKPPDRLGYHPVPNWLEDLPALRAAFEKGVAAGWAARDEEWRETIRHLLVVHTEQFSYGGEPIIPVGYIEALWQRFRTRCMVP